MNRTLHAVVCQRVLFSMALITTALSNLQRWAFVSSVISVALLIEYMEYKDLILLALPGNCASWRELWNSHIKRQQRSTETCLKIQFHSPTECNQILSKIKIMTIITYYTIFALKKNTIWVIYCKDCSDIEGLVAQKMAASKLVSAQSISWTLIL